MGPQKLLSIGYCNQLRQFKQVPSSLSTEKGSLDNFMVIVISEIYWPKAIPLSGTYIKYLHYFQ